jgi:hypothetical protein
MKNIFKLYNYQSIRQLQNMHTSKKHLFQQKAKLFFFTIKIDFSLKKNF